MRDIKSVSIGTVEIGPGVPKICVPITGKTKEEIMTQAKAAYETNPDLIEWRADFYEGDLDRETVENITKELCDIFGQIPILFTYRTPAEGGNRPISTEDYVNLNQIVSELPYIQAIDVEVFQDHAKTSQLIGAIHANDKVVIGSRHCFDTTPPRSDMITILKKLELAGADIVKLAVMPHIRGDVDNLLQTTNEATCDYLNRPAVTIAMGEKGQMSRVLGEVVGSCITFGCVGEPSAPGQIPVEDLRRQIIDLHNIVEKI